MQVSALPCLAQGQHQAALSKPVTARKAMPWMQYNDKDPNDKLVGTSHEDIFMLNLHRLSVPVAQVTLLQVRSTLTWLQSFPEYSMHASFISQH